MGIALAGAFSTCINPQYSESEILFQLQSTNAKLIVCHPLCLERVSNIMKESSLPPGFKVILMDTNEVSITVKDSLPKSSAYMSEFIDASIPVEVSSFTELNSCGFDSKNTLLTVPFSSGTTGKSKGVMLSHRNLTANIQQVLKMEGEQLQGSETVPRGRLLMPLPFFHIYGLTAGS